MWSTQRFLKGLIAAFAMSSSLFVTGERIENLPSNLQIPEESVEFSALTLTSEYEKDIPSNYEKCSEGSFRPTDDWCNNCICINGKWECTQAPCYNLNCKCGVANREFDLPVLRILGGEEILLARKYPWQVSLKWRNIHQCGGTIINDRWILTAAHCIVNMGTCIAKASSANPLKVAVGEHIHNVESDNSHVTKDYSVKQYIPHPDLDCTKTKNDFALLELTESIPFDDIIRPICLPRDDSKDYAGATGTLIGWGQTTNVIGPTSAILKELQIPIHSNDECKGWHSYFNSSKLDPTFMCAYLDSNEANSCKGDSGGPLSVYERNRYVQVGLVSFGWKINETLAACDHPTYPAIYARVSQALEWISKTSSSGSYCYQ